MNKQQARAILEGKLKEVEEAAATIAPAFREKPIHTFRVTVKKLRSFLRLINTDAEQPKMKPGKKIMQLYDIAGEIRKVQLEQKKVSKHKAAMPGYTDSLVQTLALNKAAWQRQYKPGEIKKWTRRLSGKELHKLRPKTLVVFFKKHIEALEDTADSDPDDERIHTCRKSVKNVQYNAKLAEKHWPKGYGKIAGLPLNELDQLSDMLGDYNDARLILENQMSFLKSAKKANERKALLTISNKERKAKDVQKAALLKELKKFVTATALK